MTSYQFKNGEITLSPDKLTIKDNAKKQLLIRYFSSAMWVLYGIISILRFQKTADEFLLWSGILIGISHLTILIISLFHSYKSEIPLSELKSIRVRQRMGNKFLDLRLKGNRIRRVSGIDSIEEDLNEYISKIQNV